MVRVLDHRFIGKGVKYFEYAGLSTDDKPTDNVATGSSFFEVDTTDVYFYDEGSETWIKAGGDGE